MDIPAGVAGGRGKCTASALEADIPALLRERASEPHGGQLGFARNILTLTNRGVDTPPSLSGLGHCDLSVVSFGRVCEKSVKGPTCSVSFRE